jgi:hypothetical protein
LKKLLGVGVLVVGGSAGLYLASQPIFRAPQPGAEQVVVLHGLGRTQTAMLIIENQLAGAGFEVHNIGYPSTTATPE